MTGAANEDFKASFFTECEDLLEIMQDGFDALSDNSVNSAALNEIFRAVHSIKGGAGAFDLSGIVDFAHHFENALDQMRSGALVPDESTFEFLRQCGDHLSDLIAAAQSDQPQSSLTSAVFLDRLKGLSGPETLPAAAPEFTPLAVSLDPISETGHDNDDGFVIRFAPLPGLFSSGNEPAVLFAALGRRMDIDVTVDLDAVPPLSQLDPEACFMSWKIETHGAGSEAEIYDVFEFVETVCDLNVAPKEVSEVSEHALCAAYEGTSGQELGKPLDLSEVLEEKPSRAPQPEAPVSPNTSTAKHKGPSSSGTIRVDLNRIDKLINLVGELVIKEAILSQCVAGFVPGNESQVSVALDSLKQLAGEIQEGVMAIRAQPVKPMFQRMSRIVRDSSATIGKRVKFVTIGETTEVDKTVIERLIDPLTHMVRNAIDHGLETPEERSKLGKSPEGTITLSAAHRSGRVMIEVSDDGAGINRSRVQDLAVERGLIPPDEELSPSDIDQLLFLPGFSSKQDVSELSGRGVGLDVVRNEIHRLGGRVAIQSIPGEGTTFAISLPLTLAVLEGMIVRVEDQTLVVPISAIRETVHLGQVKLHELGPKTIVMHGRDGLVPIVDLGACLGFRSSSQAPEDRVLLLIAPDAGPEFALAVDAIQDQRQVVIKSLERNYGRIPGIAAATILGDGRIALIIDPDRLSGSAVSGRPSETSTIPVAV